MVEDSAPCCSCRTTVPLGLFYAIDLDGPAVSAYACYGGSGGRSHPTHTPDEARSYRADPVFSAMIIRPARSPSPLALGSECAATVRAPPNRGSFNSTHVYGTRVPVEAPSTASKADIPPATGRHIGMQHRGRTRLGCRRPSSRPCDLRGHSRCAALGMTVFQAGPSQTSRRAWR
jgi:hypothetical protein